ncbi:MAG: type IV pilus secretin PilQ, partial [bacterium]
APPSAEAGLPSPEEGTPATAELAPPVQEEVKEEAMPQVEHPQVAEAEAMPEPEKEPALPPVKEQPSAAQGIAITDITFERVQNAVKIIIQADGPVKPNVFPLDDRIVLDFKNIRMKAQTPKEVAYPLKGIRAGEHKDKTRIVLDLTKKASYDVIAIENSVVVSLTAPDLIKPAAQAETAGKEEVKAPEPAPVPSKAEMTAKAAPAPAETMEEGIQAEEEGRYSGKRISLDFQDADIVPIFRLFADVSGYNIVVSPEVKGKITMKLINVPWDQALDLVLRTHNLGKQKEGNIIRIAPNKDLAAESEEKVRAKEAILKALPVSTRVFTINYAGVDRIKDAIDKSKVMSPRGSMTLDERASVIVINDVNETFPKIQNLINQLDRPELQVRQVLIEARIVEATTSFAKELGIQWGATGATPDGQLTIGGVSGAGGVGGAGFTGNSFIVNLPAAVAQGSGAGVGLGYLNAARTLALDLQLSALERTGVGRIVSNPRIVTMNNTAAKITQGRTIYVPVATSDKTDIKAIDALLTLDVTPSIAPGGAVLLKLKITKDEPGDVVAGNVSINRNTAETATLINSGDTVVIGGIYKDSILKSVDGVPWLSKIPVLGWLFTKKRNTEDTAEIIMFITPRVVNYEMPKITKQIE